MSDTAIATGTLDQDQTMSKRDRRALADAVRLRTKFLSLGDLDGRTGAAKRVRDLIRQIETDLGSDPSTAQRQIITRVALTSVMIEDVEARYLRGQAIDPLIHATLCNSLRRLLETIGLQRVPRDVSPSLDQIGRLIADQEAREVAEQAEDEQDAEVEAVIKETDAA